MKLPYIPAHRRPSRRQITTSTLLLMLDWSVDHISEAPMRFARLLVAISVLSVNLAHAEPAVAQVNPGIPPLNDFSNGNFDVVNISNRNIFFRIPIREKPGAIPFSSALIWNINMSVYGGGPNGYQMWAPPQYRFSASAYTSYATYSRTVYSCSPNSNYIVYNNFIYVDEGSQATHSFGTLEVVDAWQCPGTSSGTATGVAADNSGYTMTVRLPGPTMDVYDASGIHILNAAVSDYPSNIVTDTNGNSVSYLYFNGIGTYTDTLGQTVLTVNNSNNRGTTNGSPDTYSYTDAAGATRTVS